MACLPTYKNQRFKTMEDLFESIDINDLPKEALDYLINEYDWFDNQLVKLNTLSSMSIRELENKFKLRNADGSLKRYIKYEDVFKKVVKLNKENPTLRFFSINAVSGEPSDKRNYFSIAVEQRIHQLNTIESNTLNNSLEEGLQWLNKIMPDVNPEIIKGLVNDIGNGSYNTLEDIITFSEQYANKGTVKHEAVHRILALLPKEKREGILNDASKKFNIPRGKSKTTIKYSINQQNQINYTLKSIDILNSDKAKQVFEKGKKANWDLNKILTELQIPKEQKQLLLDLNITDREQLALELASNYSYSVEINTAKEKSSMIKEIKSVNGFSINGDIYDRVVDEDIFGVDDREIFTKNNKEISEQEYRDALFEYNNRIETPTQYYSNLTVPGGTNYTENEISTPLITPSIKGHAQFATDNGIGWFRSDEVANEWIDDNRGYWNPFTEEVEYTDESYGKGSTKTRRILEVQDDWLQKLKLNFRINEINYSKGTLSESDGKYHLQYYKLNKKERRQDSNSRSLTKQEYDRFKEKSKNNIVLLKGEINNEVAISTNEYFKAYDEFIDKGDILVEGYTEQQRQFAKLLANEEYGWTFRIKAIIQDSAKKGYEKVLFPSGNTASKIEGHTTLEEFKKQKEDRIKELERRRNNKLDELETTKLLDSDRRILEREVTNLDSKIITLNKELERVETEGFGALKPIYNFYETTVTNILNKTYGKENVKLITDEYGNTWNEIELSSEKVKQQSDTILFQSPELAYTGDLAIEEKIAELAENSKDEKVANTILEKFIQAIKNLFRNIFKEKDKVTRLIRNLNQGLLQPSNSKIINNEIKLIRNKPNKFKFKNNPEINPITPLLTIESNKVNELNENNTNEGEYSNKHGRFGKLIITGSGYKFLPSDESSFSLSTDKQEPIYTGDSNGSNQSKDTKEIQKQDFARRVFNKLLYSESWYASAYKEITRVFPKTSVVFIDQHTVQDTLTTIDNHIVINLNEIETKVLSEDHLDSLLSEEVIHLVYNNIITDAEKKDLFNSLSQKEIKKINQYYFTDPDTQNTLNDFQVGSEYIRMAVQQYLFNKTSEDDMLNTIKDKAPNIYNKIITALIKIKKFIINKISSDKFTTELVNKITKLEDYNTYSNNNQNSNSLLPSNGKVIDNPVKPTKLTKTSFKYISNPEINPYKFTPDKGGYSDVVSRLKSRLITLKITDKNMVIKDPNMFSRLQESWTNQAEKLYNLVSIPKVMIEDNGKVKFRDYLFNEIDYKNGVITESNKSSGDRIKLEEAGLSQQNINHFFNNYFNESHTYSDGSSSESVNKEFSVFSYIEFINKRQRTNLDVNSFNTIGEYINELNRLALEPNDISIGLLSSEEVDKRACKR